MTAGLLDAHDVTRRFVLRGGFLSKRREMTAVSDVSLSIAPGDRLAIVGESGCGKSTLGRMLLGHLAPSDGAIHYRGKAIDTIPRNERLRLRGALVEVQQNPMNALNPRLRIGGQIVEPLRIQGHEVGLETARAALDRVGLDPDFAGRYPHQLSGGQRQRVVIARALVLDAELVVFDEAVAALDVSVQSQILALIKHLHAEQSLTYVFISHDLRAVRHAADRIAVMYLGQIVELRRIEAFYAAPRHPYSAFLLSAVPELNPASRHKSRPRLAGEPPDPVDRPTGCPFHPRCALAIDRCRAQTPVLHETDGGTVACHRSDEFGSDMARAVQEQTAGAARS